VNAVSDVVDSAGDPRPREGIGTPGAHGDEDATSRAEVIAAAVAACPGVVRISDSIRSYLSGRTVDGVVITDDRVEVAIIAEYGPPLPELTERLGTALAAELGGKALWVRVDDIVTPGP
jgi:uncharacterized alkaline shock family protein YloU